MKYFISSDNDGHNFIIPLDKEKEWWEWTEIDGDDEKSWESPEWAIPIDEIENVVFENYFLDIR